MTTWRETREYILGRIHSLKEGDTLDSDRELARQIGCNVHTVKKAMGELEREGHVVRSRGKLTKVATGASIVAANEFSFSRSATTVYNKQLETQVFELAQRIPAEGDLEDVELRGQKALGLRRSERFYVLARLRKLDGTPRVIHRSYLNPAHLPGSFSVDYDFSQQSLLEVLENLGMKLDSRRTRIRAALPTAEEARVLQTGSNPVLKVEQELRVKQRGDRHAKVAEYLYAVYADWEYTIDDRGSTASTGAVEEPEND